MKTSIRFRLNGRPMSLATEDGRTLLWVLRTDLGLTGTKYGCGTGQCGACTVFVDGMERHLCRCGAHQRIVEAIAAASHIGEVS